MISDTLKESLLIKQGYRGLFAGSFFSFLILTMIGFGSNRVDLLGSFGYSALIATAAAAFVVQVRVHCVSPNNYTRIADEESSSNSGDAQENPPSPSFGPTLAPSLAGSYEPPVLNQFRLGSTSSSDSEPFSSFSDPTGDPTRLTR